jgi:hypothetical protein
MAQRGRARGRAMARPSAAAEARRRGPAPAQSSCGPCRGLRCPCSAAHLGSTLVWPSATIATSGQLSSGAAYVPPMVPAGGEGATAGGGWRQSGAAQHY